ncbi:hypothetical protein BOVMAS07_13750 [Streptococcus uberis]
MAELYIIIFFFFLYWSSTTNWFFLILLILFIYSNYAIKQKSINWIRPYDRPFWLGGILLGIVFSLLDEFLIVPPSESTKIIVKIIGYASWAIFVIFMGKKGILYTRYIEIPDKNDVFSKSEVTKEDISDKYIHKIVTGNREWFQTEKINNISSIPLNHLVSIEFEPIDVSYHRPVGSLVTINKAILQEHIDLFNNNIIKRNNQLRKSIKIPYYDSVKQRGFHDSDGAFHNLWERAHTITFRFSLDEGQTKGLTFSGTSYANGGTRIVNNKKIEISKSEHSLIANNLMEEFLNNYKNNENPYILDEQEIDIYLYNRFTKFDINELRNNNVTFISNDENDNNPNYFQLSMNDYEILSERIINYFQGDEFIYSTELLYSEKMPLIPETIQIVLFNKTKNHISFVADIANIES